MKKLFYLLCVAVFGISCTDDELTVSAPSLPDGKTVSVELSFQSLGYDTPFSGSSRVCGGNVFSYISPELEVALKNNPGPSARTVGVEDAIYGYWVLQFNGREAGSSLKRIRYYDCPGGVIATNTVDLYAETGLKQRIVVVANVGNEANSPLKDLTENVFTYGAFQNISFTSVGHAAFPLYTASYMDGPLSIRRNLMVMCGVNDAIITADTKHVVVVLGRTVAKVDVPPITVSAPLRTKYRQWTAVLMNIPGNSYLNPLGRIGAFPGPAAVPGAPKIWELDTLTGLFEAQSFYLPVNQQESVPLTTFLERRKRAPIGGTYLQITGQNIIFDREDVDKRVPVMKDIVMYQIYLGTNFTDNYSIPPNYWLTYGITLNGESTDDSGVVRFIPGYFGGELKGYKRDGTEVEADDANAVKWRFQKRIEVYSVDVRNVITDASAPALGSGTMHWIKNSNNIPAGVGSMTDMMAGRNNSLNPLKANPRGHYCTAVANCASRLNGEYYLGSEIYSKLAPDCWYLPAIGQLIGIWISASGVINTMSGNGFWSSTLDDGSSGNNAFVIDLQGGVKKAAVTTDNLSVRAVRELKD